MKHPPQLAQSATRLCPWISSSGEGISRETNLHLIMNRTVTPLRPLLGPSVTSVVTRNTKILTAESFQLIETFKTMWLCLWRLASQFFFRHAVDGRRDLDRSIPRVNCESRGVECLHVVNWTAVNYVEAPKLRLSRSRPAFLAGSWPKYLTSKIVHFTTFLTTAKWFEWATSTTSSAKIHLITEFVSVYIYIYIYLACLTSQSARCMVQWYLHQIWWVNADLTPPFAHVSLESICDTHQLPWWFFWWNLQTIEPEKCPKEVNLPNTWLGHNDNDMVWYDMIWCIKWYDIVWHCII